MSFQGRHSLPRYEYPKPSQSSTLSQASHQKSSSSLITQSPGLSRIPSIPRSHRHDNIGGGINTSFNTHHEGSHQQSQQNQRTSSSPYTRLNYPYSQHNSSMISASAQNDISTYSHSQQSHPWGSCEEHGEPATNFCANVECLIPLCPDCIDDHYQLHSERQTVPQLESLKSVKKKCSTKIEVAVSQLKSQIVEFEESVQLDPQAMFKEAMSKINNAKLDLIQIIDRVFEGFEVAAEKLVQENLVQVGDLKQQLSEVNELVFELQQLKNELDTSSSILSISKICRLDVLSLRDQFRIRMQKAANQRDFCRPIDVSINESAFQEFNQAIESILTVTKQQIQQFQQPPASIAGSNRQAQRDKSREKFEEPPQQGRNSVVSQSQGSLSIQQQLFPSQPFTPQQKAMMLPPKSNNFIDSKRQNAIPKAASQQLQDDQLGYEQHSQSQQYYQQQQQESQMIAALAATQENQNRVSNRIKERSDSKNSKEINNIDSMHFQSVSSVPGNKDNYAISERDFDGWEDKLDERKPTSVGTSGVQMKQQSQMLQQQLQTQQQQLLQQQQQQLQQQQQHQEMNQQYPQEYSEQVGRLSISPQELDIRAADYFDSACGAKIIHYITHLAASQDSNSNVPVKDMLDDQGQKELCMLFADLSTEAHANLLRCTMNNRNLSLNNNDGILNNIQLRYLPLYLEDPQLLTAKEPKSLSLPNGDIFIFGGNDAGQVLKLDWSNSSLIAYGQPMKQVAYDFGISLLRHSVFVIGGVMSQKLNNKNELDTGKSDFLPSSSCQKFNIRTGKWENITPMNEAVSKPSVCAFNNRFIFRIGGFLPSGQPSKNIEKYDIILNKWYQISLPAFQFTLPPSAAVSQINPRQLIIVGGLLEQTTASKRVMVLSIDENRDPESVGISSREETFSYNLQQMPSLQLAVPSAFQAIPFIFGGSMHLLDSDAHTQKMQLHLFNGKTWNTVQAAI